MILLVLLATLPSLYWAAPVDTAPALRKAGIESLCVPPESVAAWQRAGFAAVPLGERERRARVLLRAPGVAARAEVASATSRPWVFANGWRYLRASDGRFWSEVPARQSALAVAEAFVYRADVVLAIEPPGLEEAGRMLAFLSSVPETDLPPAADIAIQDDGSALAGEVLNLMARHNLLFQVVRAPVADSRLNVRIGSEEFPRKAALNPEAFSLSVRRRLTDEKRSLRLYGSEAVLGRLLRDVSRGRLHLLNYGGRPIEGLRVRLLGRWAPPEALVFGEGRVAVEDYVTTGDGATEFSLPTLGSYAVVELRAAN
ncbi:MAG TPA: hypothetical protein VLF95_03450 [Vicinamibacteria bacterium]|nr:hypothetical protein [Vicinamibacteria bacterium]